jgi:hypothetical protein
VVIEVERVVDVNSRAAPNGQNLKVGPEPAQQKGRAAPGRTPRPRRPRRHPRQDTAFTYSGPARIKLRGARVATTPTPLTAPGPVSVQRKSSLTVSSWSPANGAGWAAPTPGGIVTIQVEDTHYRVTCDGADISLRARSNDHPIRHWKAKIHAAKLRPATSITSRDCQRSAEPNVSSTSRDDPRHLDITSFVRVNQRL